MGTSADPAATSDAMSSGESARSRDGRPERRPRDRPHRRRQKLRGDPRRAASASASASALVRTSPSATSAQHGRTASAASLQRPPARAGTSPRVGVAGYISADQIRRLPRRRAPRRRRRAPPTRGRRRRDLRFGEERAVLALERARARHPARPPARHRRLPARAPGRAPARRRRRRARAPSSERSASLAPAARYVFLHVSPKLSAGVPRRLHAHGRRNRAPPCAP